MAKTFKNLFEKIVDFQNLLIAAKKAQRGKRYRESTLDFNFELERNLFKLQDELVQKTYQPGLYRDFIVRDSKKRLISAAPYRDRVIHHAVMNILDPIFDSIFIYDTYACRKGKGTHAALFRFREFLEKYRYVLKCDVRKYFHCIDHEILLSKLQKKIADGNALWLLEKIISSWDNNWLKTPAYFPGDDLFSPWKRRRGIPVGNLTSQFLANLYLNDFDHLLKEKFKVGSYLRYVDDFCVFENNKEKLNEIREAIVTLLREHRLCLHGGKSRIYTTAEGVEFLGFRHLRANTRIRTENVKRFKHRMRALQSDYRQGIIPIDRVTSSVVAWVAHASYADSYRLRKEIIPSFSFSKRGRTEREPCSSRRELEQ